jgi:hypothetical protein
MYGITHFLKTASLGILLLFQFYFLYSGNFDYLLFSKDWTWICFLLIFIAIPANAYEFSKIAFAKHENLQVAGMFISIISIAINGPCFGLWTGKHEKECYAKYGIKTWGIVTSSFYNRGPRMYYEFYIGDAFYPSYNVKNPLRHAYGDSVEVIYNSRCPDMNAAIENIDDL